MSGVKFKRVKKEDPACGGGGSEASHQVLGGAPCRRRRPAGCPWRRVMTRRVGAPERWSRVASEMKQLRERDSGGHREALAAVSPFACQ
jgi:hypothetical protein